MEKREPSYTVGGNGNLYSHYREQCGDSLKNWKDPLQYCKVTSLQLIKINEKKKKYWKKKQNWK